MKRFFALSLLLAACTRTLVQGPARPEDMVQRFVHISAQAQSVGDRRKLMDMTHGQMHKVLEGMSEDAFKLTYLNQTIKLKDFKVIDSKVDGNLAVVHYQVQVENPNGQDHTEENIEREVECLRVGDSWFATAIRPKGSDQIAFTRGMIF